MLSTIHLLTEETNGAVLYRDGNNVLCAIVDGYNVSFEINPDCTITQGFITPLPARESEHAWKRVYVIAINTNSQQFKLSNTKAAPANVIAKLDIYIAKLSEALRVFTSKFRIIYCLSPN